MQLIDIHTHQAPAGAGRLFIMNRFPENSFPELPPGGFFSVGLHPWYIGHDKVYRRQIEQVANLVSKDEVIALGECGLDKVCKTDFQLQLDVFLRQCEIAESLNKPVILHVVKAWNDIYHLKRRLNPRVPWILHGYNGNDMVTRQLMDQGFYFSFGNALLDDRSSARSAITLIPLEQLFFETDEDPLSIAAVYDMASELIQVKTDVLAEKIEWNFRQVFVRQ